MKKNKTIMIVNDDKLVCGAFQGLLELYGHTILCCNNGLDAVMLSKKHNFDMILAYYNLPGIKGDEVCRLIRGQSPHAFIVGLSIESKDKDFMDAGANKFIYQDHLVQNFSILDAILQMTI